MRAAKTAKTAKKTKRPVIVIADVLGDTIKPSRARPCLYWGIDVKGIYGVSHGGADREVSGRTGHGADSA